MRHRFLLFCSAAVAALLPAVSLVPAHAYTVSGTYFSGYYTNSSGTRYYEGYVPPSYTPGTAVPLIVALHGCGQTADVFRQLTEFDMLAQSDNFIVVFPQQSTAANLSGCWNWFLSADMHRGSGEPSIIAGITQWVQQHYTIDPKRIFVTGVSAGGAMTSVMGATYPDLYAAIGVASGCEYDGYPCGINGGTAPATAGQAAYQAMGSYARVMPAMIFHGSADTTVYPINAQQDVSQWQVTADYADDGSYNGSIPTSPSSTTNGQVPGGESYTINYYVDGKGHELEQYWLVNGMGHAWGDGCTCETFDDPSAPNESQAFYSFFMNHPHP